jgi:dolichol kinase
MQIADEPDVLLTPAEPEPEHIDYKYELARKTVHLCSISIPVIYSHITKELALVILVPMFLMSIFFDTLRFYSKGFAAFYYKLFGSILRSHETNHDKKSFNGATYVLLSAVLCVLLFPKMIGVGVFAILIVADTAAALVGRKFGKHKIATKTVEGSAAFFVFALIVMIFTPQINVFVKGATAVVATVTELFPIKIFGFSLDDNLTIPVFAGLFAYLCYVIFLPEQLGRLEFLPN